MAVRAKGTHKPKGKRQKKFGRATARGKAKTVRKVRKNRKATKIQALIDSRELYGNRTEGPWERRPVDPQWWRAQSLPFPSPPIKGTSTLVPVSSLDDLVNVHRQMRIPLDNYWMRAVLSPGWGTAYFFKWLDDPLALVLTTFGVKGLNHVECRGQGDKHVPMPHRSRILASVIDAFAAAGFEVGEAQTKVRKSRLN